ncbi:hypothetical protein FIU82_14180 [Pseudoalteromonas sp. THAF3]|uniref:DUF924 family protein n=1 Tax=Pseudoalteromonas sp. THAF3 TaxID=2587843 RepID=UPI00126973D6|nr:DUF924 family protein [Pseudoalteromonas sp. THAF3]QFU06137.1 hypothetical protein FIU82_14180 [Pseudoalteromonas sp. THAF3]
MQYESVYEFWFTHSSPQDWFKKSADFDATVKKQFLPTYEAARQGELYSWRKSARGALCEIIVLDQFPRNMFRDTAQAFATDALALCLAQNAVEKKFALELDDTERSFLYMPYMHSESQAIHVVAEQLFRPLSNYKYELAHKEIIDRFGRYPHRNDILGRQSSDTEQAFLNQPGSRF